MSVEPGSRLPACFERVLPRPYGLGGSEHFASASPTPAVRFPRTKDRDCGSSALADATSEGDAKTMSEPPRSWGELPEQAPGYDLRSGQPLDKPVDDLGFWAPDSRSDRAGQDPYVGPEHPHQDQYVPPSQWSTQAETPRLPANRNEPPQNRGLMLALVGLAVSVLLVGAVIGAAIAFTRNDSTPQAANSGGSAQPQPQAAQSAPQPNPSVIVTVPGPVVTVPGAGSGSSRGTVRQVTPGHYLNRRAQPNPDLPTLGQVLGGRSVSIVCQLL